MVTLDNIFELAGDKIQVVKELETKIKEVTKNQNLITTRVQDENKIYTVRISDYDELIHTCNCEADNKYCVHVLAVLIYLIKNNLIRAKQLIEKTNSEKTLIDIHVKKHNNNILIELKKEKTLIVSELKKLLLEITDQQKEIIQLALAAIERQEGSDQTVPAIINGISSYIEQTLLDTLRIKQHPVKGIKISYNPIPLQLDLLGDKIEPYILLQNKKKYLKDLTVFGSEIIWVVYDNNLYQLDLHNPRSLLNLSEQLNLDIPLSFLKEHIQKIFYDMGKKGRIYNSNRADINEIIGIPEPKLYLDEKDSVLQITPVISYYDKEISFNQKSDLYIHNQNIINKIIRDYDKEKYYHELLLDHNIKKSQQKYFLTKDPLLWLAEDMPVLADKGYTILGHEKLVKLKHKITKQQLKITVQTSNDWLELKGEVNFDGEIIPLSSLLKIIRNKKKFVKLADRSNTKISDEIYYKLQKLVHTAKITQDKVLLPKIKAKTVHEVCKIADKKNYNKAFVDLIKNITEFKGIEKVVVGDGFKATLYKYQQAGLDWLFFCQKNKFGALLADDMGLGKSCQVIALLHTHYKKKIDKPSIIIVPTSLVHNWEREINKFSNTLTTYIHHGKNKKKNFDQKQANIIITTYNTLLNDQINLLNLSYEYAIIDEAQYQKNPRSKIAKTLSKIKSNYKIAITGTPIENNLLELWSHFNFLNPGLLGDMKEFDKKYSKAIEKPEILEELKQTIKPFVLQRKKEQVADELPEKLIFTTYYDMEEQQEKLYNKVKDSYRYHIINKLEEKASINTLVFEGLLRLRQIANHPKLLYPETHIPSGKFTGLFEQIRTVVWEERKVLVFSSFLPMLKLLQETLEQNSIQTLYLDGSTKNRMDLVNEFQTNPDKKVFLISLKAGGVGLTLTAADTVFIVDPWWNPAVEMQAMDRAHRIGQKRKVFVYKAITKNTVEEKIILLQEQKTFLSEQVIESEREFIKHLTIQDIQSIFS